jgi:hypothetical protein
MSSRTGRGDAKHTIFALVEVNVARCPVRLDGLLCAVPGLWRSAHVQVDEFGGAYSEVALAGLEGD